MLDPDVPGRASPSLPTTGLMLLAARVGTRPVDALNDALDAGPDWTAVIQLALRHRMAPALLAALEAADSRLVPVDLFESLRTHCDALREQSRQSLGELLELLSALDRQGVRAVPFKGPLLGEMLFGDAGHRAPGDLDILVRRDQVAVVRDVLEGRGYVDADLAPGTPHMTAVQRQMYERFQCEYQFIRASDSMVVEPHWGLSQRTLAIDVDYAGMLDRARPTTLAGGPVLTLSAEDLLLALCIHGAKHRWERLAWIRDVAALLAVSPDLDLMACLDQARHSGCSRILLLGVSVAERCAGARLPDTLSEAIAADGMVGRLTDDVEKGLFAPYEPLPWNDRLDAFRLRMRERWADRARYVARTWLTPRRPHIEMFDLPGPLRWAYVPVKVGLDYAILPIWGLIKRGSSRS